MLQGAARWAVFPGLSILAGAVAGLLTSASVDFMDGGFLFYLGATLGGAGAAGVVVFRRLWMGASLACACALLGVAQTLNAISGNRGDFWDAVTSPYTVGGVLIIALPLIVLHAMRVKRALPLAGWLYGAAGAASALGTVALINTGVALQSFLFCEALYVGSWAALEVALRVSRP